MNTRRLAAAIITLAAAASLTACSSSGGEEVTTKPNTSATSERENKDTGQADTAKKEQTAKVGDTITVTGTEPGSKLDVTVVKTADNALSQGDVFEPNKGHRWYAVQFQLVNTGSKAYADSPQNGAQITDSEGQQFDTMLVDVTAGPSMGTDVKLKPGAKALGWIVFEVAKDSKPATVQFTMDSGFAEQTGEWAL